VLAFQKLLAAFHELASTMPGVEEVALFDRMGELIVTRIDSYDLVVFDTAPTGHTMRLLRMPELMSSWIDALSKRRRNLMTFGQNIEKAGPEPDPILTTLERRKGKLELVRARLMQHNFTGFVLVLIPERLPIEESARTAELLRDANVNVCGILVNRVLPDNLEGDFYQARR
jgi:arsenite-transporting ATPase